MLFLTIKHCKLVRLLHIFHSDGEDLHQRILCFLITFLSAVLFASSSEHLDKRFRAFQTQPSLPRSLANTYPFNYSIIYSHTHTHTLTHTDTQTLHAQHRPMESKCTVNTVAGLVLQTHVQRNKQPITPHREAHGHTRTHKYICSFMSN